MTNYLDSEEFREFTKEVEKILIGKELTISEMRIALQDKFKERWIFDALDSLYVNSTDIAPRKFSLRTTPMKTLAEYSWRGELKL